MRPDSGDLRPDFLPGLNPLTKLSSLIIVTVMTFFAKSLTEVSVLLLLMLLLLWVSRVGVGGLKWLFIPVLGAVPGTLGVFIISYWFESGNLHASVLRGSIEASSYLGRLCLLVVGNIIFVRTTDFRKLTEVLHDVGMPSMAVLLLATVFRFFPVLLGEVERVFEVQRSRGLKLRQLLVPKHWIALAIPFFVVTIQRAYELALSFYTRSGLIHGQRKRVSIHLNDVLAIGVVVCVFVVHLACSGG